MSRTPDSKMHVLNITRSIVINGSKGRLLVDDQGKYAED